MYLGYLTDGRNTQKDLRKVLTIIDEQRPEDEKGVKQFLRPVMYYLEFIPDVSTVSPPTNYSRAESQPTLDLFIASRSTHYLQKYNYTINYWNIFQTIHHLCYICVYLESPTEHKSKGHIHLSST